MEFVGIILFLIHFTRQRSFFFLMQFVWIMQWTYIFFKVGQYVFNLVFICILYFFVIFARYVNKLVWFIKFYLDVHFKKNLCETGIILFGYPNQSQTATWKSYHAWHIVLITHKCFSFGWGVDYPAIYNNNSRTYQLLLDSLLLQKIKMNPLKRGKSLFLITKRLEICIS